MKKKGLIEIEEIESSKNSRIERLSLEDSDSKSKFLLRKRDSKRLPEKNSRGRELFVKSKKKQRDKEEEGTGRLKSKKDLSILSNPRKKSTS
jgi:hypothetical protein